MDRFHDLRIAKLRSTVFDCRTMQLKQLESALQCVPVFAQPNVAVEQYPTWPPLAPRMIHTIDSVYDDIRERDIADFGCETDALR
jgi:predicted RNA methylase